MREPTSADWLRNSNTLQGGKRAVFLDRDGTLNVEKNYLYRWQDWDWVPGAIDAVRILLELNFLLVVVTNQAGIARGYYRREDVDTLHELVSQDLGRHGLAIDAYYCCPHHPNFGDARDCDCRKPRPGMLIRAAEELGIDLQRSWMIGDRISDVDAGIRAGTHSILVRTGYGPTERASPSTIVVDDVLAAARYIANLDFGNVSSSDA